MADTDDTTEDTENTVHTFLEGDIMANPILMLINLDPPYPFPK